MSVWKTYREKLREISQAVVAAQGPILILDSLKWDQDIKNRFFASRFKALPVVSDEYYQNSKIAYDPEIKINEFKEIQGRIKTDLGPDDELGKILYETADQYIDVVNLVTARGTKRFYEISKKLWGGSKDPFYSNQMTVSDLGKILYPILDKSLKLNQGAEFAKEFSADNTVKILSARLAPYFGDHEIFVQPDDGILADSSAGGATIKVREGAMFSARDIDILEVHEGWVHIGTNQNGKRQSVASWLSKGPPRVSGTQEGLAQLVEIFTFRSFPARAKKISDRLIAVSKAEEGANFIDVFNYFQSEGYSEDDSYNSSQRIFRGGLIEGGAPFTKDLGYCKGFVENYNFIRTCIGMGQPDALPFLFVGKVNIEDVPVLYRKHQEGIIDFPKFLPPMFADLNGLAVWMSYSHIFNQLDLKDIQVRYKSLFA